MQSAWTDFRNLQQGKIVNLPVDSVRLGGFGIRSEAGDLIGLKQSILQYGLLQPILVRQTEHSQFEVVAGNRRLKVFGELKVPNIPAIIIEADDKSSFELSLTENVQRQTLDPLDEARAFYNYVRSEKKRGLGYGSISELAERIGKSQEYVSNRISLLRLPELTLRQLLQRGNFKVSHAEELASLSDNLGVANELAHLVADNKISVRVLEKAIPLIKAGVALPKALELARIESDLKLKPISQKDNSDLLCVLMKRTKSVLQTALLYVDNVMSELDTKSTVYEDWVTRVRLPVHKAIDGVIVCEKKNGIKKRKAAEHTGGTCGSGKAIRDFDR